VIFHAHRLTKRKTEVMKVELHKSWIGVISEHVEAWYKSEGLSRESVADLIVDAHYRIGADKSTGIVFDASDGDTYNRMKTNAQRIFRWLDDASKDTNLITVNFLPSVLSAMPEHIRSHCLNELLLALGLGVRGLSSSSGSDCVLQNFQALLCESNEANQSVLNLLKGETQEALTSARKELSESIEESKKNLSYIESQLLKHDQQNNKIKRVK